MKSVPYSYQQEPIPLMIGSRQPFEPLPMGSQYRDPSIAHSNSFKNNRIAPQQSEYSGYSQPNNSFRTPSSLNSTKQLMKPPQSYSMKQAATDSVYPYNYDQSFYPHNSYVESTYPDDDLQQNEETSWCAQRTCLGLTRLTGGCLFGTMIVLGTASIGGLIAAVILYVQEPTVNSQWKVLGIVVCSIMIVTILITLCIFIYCYKNNHIGENGSKSNFTSPPYNQQMDLGRLNNYNSPYAVPSLPYGVVQNTSPLSVYEDVIQVEDKQTNTEMTMAPLRPRDAQRGVWPAANAYGGLSYRSLEKPRTTHRHVQTTPNETDHMGLQSKSNSVRSRPTTIVRLTDNHTEHDEEPYPNRFIDVKPHQNASERTTKKSKRRLVEEYVEFNELPRNEDRAQHGHAKQKDRYTKVSIKRVKTNEESNSVDDEYKTDHFYQ